MTSALADGLYQVEYGSLCAGFTVEYGLVRHCAPILRRKLSYFQTIAQRVEQERHPPTDLIRAAIISDDGRYRYVLSRSWEPDLPCVLFIMLNPSIADGLIDDATIRKCIGFARKWGYGGIWVVNLYALRATDHRELWKVSPAERIGPLNDAWIEQMVQIAGDNVVLAWGAHNRDDNRIAEVKHFLHGHARCLGVNMNGSPRHPLMLAYDTPLESVT